MERQRATAESWKIKPMPAARKELAVAGVYSPEDYGRISLGFIPQEMDDKWFIYLDGEWLHFHRSWTGSCIYQLQIVPAGNDYHAVKAIVNRDAEQYRGTDDAYDVSVISFLIDRILLDRFAAFPSMRGLSSEDQTRHQQLMMGHKEADDHSIRLRMVNGRSPSSNQ